VLVAMTLGTAVIGHILEGGRLLGLEGGAGSLGRRLGQRGAYPGPMAWVAGHRATSRDSVVQCRGCCYSRRGWGGVAVECATASLLVERSRRRRMVTAVWGPI
jgi:hypothetical protein